MRSIGFPELLVTLVVIALLVGIFKSRRKGNKRQEPVATTRSSTSGSSGYYPRHRGNCTKCGADLDTNDPHAPGCPRGGG